MVSGRPEARLERGFRYGNGERTVFRLPMNGTELAHDRLPVLEMATSDEVIGPSRDRGVELGVEVRGSLVRVGLIGRHCETQLLTVRDGGTSRHNGEGIIRVEVRDLVRLMLRLDPIQGSIKVRRRRTQHFDEVSVALGPQGVR